MGAQHTIDFGDLTQLLSEGVPRLTYFRDLSTSSGSKCNQGLEHNV